VPEVLVCSAAEARKMRATSNGVVIAVRDLGTPAIPLKAGWKAVLSLEIPDVDVHGLGDQAWDLAAPAREVAQFVRLHAAATRILLHCHLGVSRSRSIAAAICEHHRWPYAWTVLHQPLYDAVLTALRREGQTGHSTESVPENSE
jgi:predicted protein tyrosine phosphatase